MPISQGYHLSASLEFRVGGIGHVEGGGSPAKRTLDATDPSSGSRARAWQSLGAPGSQAREREFAT